MVYCKGINDMPRGWYSAEYNKRVYHVWRNMIKRCYSEKLHEKYPTYKDCYCCERWLTLSNFVEDIKLIDGYELWLSGFGEKINPYQLDKDVKSNGQNKCYCLENCMFITQSENLKQANKTRDYDDMKGEKNPMFGVHRYGEKAPRHGELVAQIDKNTNKIINIKYNGEYARLLRFNAGHITACCRGKRKTHKSYIWKYISNCTDKQINEYIIRTKQIKIE